MSSVSLNFAHICENAFLSETQNLNIIGDFDEMRIDSDLPTRVSFFVVTSFIVEPNKKYTANVTVLDDTGAVTYQSPNIEQSTDKNKVGLLLKVDTTFSKFGKYIVRITFGDDFVKDLDLNVIPRT